LFPPVQRNETIVQDMLFHCSPDTKAAAAAAAAATTTTTKKNF